MSTENTPTKKNSNKPVIVCMSAFLLYLLSQSVNSATEFVILFLVVSIPFILGACVFKIANILTSQPAPVQVAPKNQSVSTKRIRGEQIMDIPAYARKEKNAAYPITKSILENGLVITTTN